MRAASCSPASIEAAISHRRLSFHTEAEAPMALSSSSVRSLVKGCTIVPTNAVYASSDLSWRHLEVLTSIHCIDSLIIILAEAQLGDEWLGERTFAVTRSISCVQPGTSSRIPFGGAQPFSSSHTAPRWCRSSSDGLPLD